MAYVSPNFRSKKDLRQALIDGQCVVVFQPGLGSVPTNGTISLEGPHYPQPHRWWATGTIVEGKLVRVK